MVTGHVRRMQETDPRKVAISYERSRWSEVFDNNPRIARQGEKGDFQVYQPRVNGMRPYCSAKTPDKWTWRDNPPPVGEIWLTDLEKEFKASEAAEVIIEPNRKGNA